MRHVESGIDIDVTFGGLSFEQAAIDNSEIHDIAAACTPAPRRDLLIMKAVARRPKICRTSKAACRAS